MASTFELEVATPERLIIREQVTEAQIPALGGEIGVLPGHAALLSQLGIGILTYVTAGQRNSVAVSDGVVQVLPDHVRVLAQTAERANEVDLARAREAEKRAMSRLNDLKGNIDYARALNALRRAQARMTLAK